MNPSLAHSKPSNFGSRRPRSFATILATRWVASALLACIAAGCGAIRPEARREARRVSASATSGSGSSAAEVANDGAVMSDANALPSAGAAPSGPSGPSGDLELIADRILPLAELQSLSRRRHPRRRELAARLSAATARVRQAQSAYFPTLSTRGEYSRVESEVAFPDPGGGPPIVVVDRDAYNQATTLGFLVFNGGARGASYRASRGELEAEEQLVARDFQDLDLRVAEAVHAYVEARQEAEVLVASTASLEGALKIAQDLESVGRATRADVLVVEVQLERTRFDARRLEDSARSAREELATLLYLHPDTDFVLESPVLSGARDRDGIVPDIDTCVGIALERRSDLHALEASSRAAEEAMSAEKGQLLPRVDVFVQHDYSTTDSGFRDPDFFSGGVRVEWPLFTGFSTLHRVRELESRLEEIRARHESLELEIVLEVRRAHRDLGRAFDGIDVSRKGVESAEENARRVTDWFREGKATGQEVLEAETLLRTEKARGVQARFAVERALSRLRHASGLDYDDELRDGPTPGGDGS
jgi:outer membrane protein